MIIIISAPVTKEKLKKPTGFSRMLEWRPLPKSWTQGISFQHWHSFLVNFMGKVFGLLHVVFEWCFFLDFDGFAKNLAGINICLLGYLRSKVVPQQISQLLLEEMVVRTTSRQLQEQLRLVEGSHQVYLFLWHFSASCLQFTYHLDLPKANHRGPLWSPFRVGI